MIRKWLLMVQPEYLAGGLILHFTLLRSYFIPWVLEGSSNEDRRVCLLILLECFHPSLLFSFSPILWIGWNSFLMISPFKSSKTKFFLRPCIQFLSHSLNWLKFLLDKPMWNSIFIPRSSSPFGHQFLIRLIEIGWCRFVALEKPFPLPFALFVLQI